MKRLSATSTGIVKVGTGRGFIVRYRREDLGVGGRAYFVRERAVITAAHCLGGLPSPYPEKHGRENLFPSLLGTLDGNEQEVTTECLFVDPVADIAWVGRPAAEELSEEADAYDALMADRPAFSIGWPPRKGTGHILALDGHWIRVPMESIGHWLWHDLDPRIEPGMSGSPIVAEDGKAVALIANGPFLGRAGRSPGIAKSDSQPALVQCLPPRILRMSHRSV